MNPHESDTYGALRTIIAHAPLTDTEARTLCGVWADAGSALAKVATGEWSAPLSADQLAAFLVCAKVTYPGRGAATFEIRSALCTWARRNTV